MNRRGSFVCVVAMVAAAAGGANAQGTISGTVTTTRTTLPPLRVTIDQRVCGAELPDDAIVTGAAGGVANAVVILSGVKARAPHPAAAGIVNDRCRFAPRVQIVRPNAMMTTSSRDPILHTTNAQLGSTTLFNVALPIPSVSITRPVRGAGLVRVSCNTHPWMRGWVVVTDEMAVVTGADGRFTLPDVPAGTYELRVWHEALQAPSQKIVVSNSQTATVSFALR